MLKPWEKTLILKTLKELEVEQYKEFLWHLGNDHGDKISGSRLENLEKNKMATADCMQQIFCDKAMQITEDILENIGRYDLKNTFSESRISKGHAATKATEDRPPTKPVPLADTPGPMQTDSPSSTDPATTALLLPTRAPKSPVNDSPSVPPGSRNRKDYLKHFSHLKLDTNTAHIDLSLSENNMVATWRRSGPRPRPDHPDRFDHWHQVLCTEGLTGPCYWEVEWKRDVTIAVTYGGISRKGRDDSMLGKNDKSWSLRCDNVSYSVRHNSKGTLLPVRPSRLSKRVAVYLDCPLGNLSFYEVRSDSLTHLHTFTFHNTSSEPLYAGFMLGSPSCSVRLCEQR